MKSSPSPQVSVDLPQAIRLLNQVAAADPRATAALLEHRVPCSAQFADHPSVQVVRESRPGESPSGHVVGMLGVINGLFADPVSGWGLVTARLEDQAPGEDRWLTCEGFALTPRFATSIDAHVEALLAVCGTHRDDHFSLEDAVAWRAPCGADDVAGAAITSRAALADLARFDPRAAPSKLAVAALPSALFLRPSTATEGPCGHVWAGLEADAFTALSQAAARTREMLGELPPDVASLRAIEAAARPGLERALPWLVVRAEVEAEVARMKAEASPTTGEPDAR